MNRRTKVALGTITGFVLLGGSAYLLTRPRYRPASMEAVRKVVAPELLIEPSYDVDVARKRYARVSELVQKINSELLVQRSASAPGLPPGSPSASATGSAPAKIDSPEMRELHRLLSAGPIDQRVTAEQTYSASWGTPLPAIRGLAKGLQAAMAESVADKNWALLEQQFAFAGLFRQRIADSTNLIQYLVAIAIGAIFDNQALKVAANPDVPASTKRAILATLPEPSPSDTLLANAIRGEFQWVVLARVPDPWTFFDKTGQGPSTMWDIDGDAPKRSNHFGSYDAIESAKLESDLSMEMLRNTELPKSRLVHSVFDRVSRLQATLPEMPDSGSGTKNGLKWTWFTYRMNLIPNSLGIFNAATLSTTDLMSASYRQRTQTEQVRAALAAGIFAKEHGHEPHRFDDLIRAGLLERAPYDYTNERPMAFDLPKLRTWPRIKTVP